MTSSSGIHRHQDVDFLAAADVAVLTGANGDQVGRPAMFEGNIFLPETGMPIWKMDRISTELAVWLPDPFTVATCMLKSLTTGWLDCPGRESAGDTSNVDIDKESFGREMWPSSLFL